VLARDGAGRDDDADGRDRAATARDQDAADRDAVAALRETESVARDGELREDLSMRQAAADLAAQGDSASSVEGTDGLEAFEEATVRAEIAFADAGLLRRLLSESLFEMRTARRDARADRRASERDRVAAAADRLAAAEDRVAAAAARDQAQIDANTTAPVGRDGP
jgi:hypothetical protein